MVRVVAEVSPLTSKPGSRRPAYPVASVDRVLRLLFALTERERLGVTEVAQLLGSSASTAHRMLQMLVSYELVEQDERRLYGRGRGLDRLASAHNRNADSTGMIEIAEPFLMRVRDDLRATTHLITLEGNGARFLAGAEQFDPSGLSVSRVGWLLPAHTSAGGKMLLAYLSDSALAALYPDGLPLTRSGRACSMSQFRRELRQARSWQWARSLREVHADVSAIAVPVFGAHGAPRYVLSAGWRADDYPFASEQSVVGVLRAASAGISASLRQCAVPAIAESGPHIRSGTST